MPSRILREEICDSERLNKISSDAERLCSRLMVKADDLGNFEATPPAVGPACFPRWFQCDDTRKLAKLYTQIKGWLKELSDVGLIYFYTHEGRRYLHFYKWKQRLDRIKQKFPKHPERELVATSEPSGNQVETSGMPSSVSDSDLGLAGMGSQPTTEVSNRSQELKSDEAWLDALSKNSAYSRINVFVEWGKMSAWCDVNKKKTTRRRFVNWLNRCDSPINLKPRHEGPNI